MLRIRKTNRDSISGLEADLRRSWPASIGHCVARCWQRLVLVVRIYVHQRDMPSLDLSTVERQAPTFAAQTLDSDRFRPQEHRGEVVVMNVWATWCPPCRAEAPRFVGLQGGLRDEGAVRGPYCRPGGGRGGAASHGGRGRRFPPDRRSVRDGPTPSGRVGTAYVSDQQAESHRLPLHYRDAKAGAQRCLQWRADGAKRGEIPPDVGLTMPQWEPYALRATP